MIFKYLNSCVDCGNTWKYSWKLFLLEFVNYAFHLLHFDKGILVDENVLCLSTLFDYLLMVVWHYVCSFIIILWYIVSQTYLIFTLLTCDTNKPAEYFCFLEMDLWKWKYILKEVWFNYGFKIWKFVLNVELFYRFESFFL